MAIFAWATIVFFHLVRAPDQTLEIYSTGKRWMWRFQHIDGQSEINELHVPLGRPVKVTFTSEDVLHSLFIPAFRVKADAIPGRYSSVWFTPTKTGEYHLFCAEYCGTKHSGMIGTRRRHGAERLPGLAERRRWRPLDVGARRAAVPAAWLRQLSPDTTGPGAVRRSRASTASRSSWRTARPWSSTTPTSANRS